MKEMTGWKRLRILVTAAIVLVGAAAVVVAEGQQEMAPADADDGVVEIEMVRGEEFTFVNDPIGIHVEPGTTIRFTSVQASHTATAYHPDNGKDLRIPEGAEPWDSGSVAPGQSYEVTLEVEGVYDYYCAPHEHLGHVGRIIVGDPDASPAVDASDLPGSAPDAMPSVAAIVENGVVKAD